MKVLYLTHKTKSQERIFFGRQVLLIMLENEWLIKICIFFDYNLQYKTNIQASEVVQLVSPLFQNIALRHWVFVAQRSENL